MMTKPRFKYAYTVEGVGEKHVFLLNEREYIALEGGAYRRLAPLLDGEHTVDEILDELDGQVSLSEVLYALQALEKKGYLVEADDSLPLPAAAFWNCLGVDTREATARLQDARVVVQSVGGAGSDGLVEALGSLGIQLGEPGDLKVVVTDDYLQEGLEGINEEALGSGRPWMLVKAVGMVQWLGPIFRPGETGCWACLAQRLRANRQVEGYILRHTGRTKPLSTSRAMLPTTKQVAVNLAATEVARWLVTGENERLEGKVLTVDVATLERREHILVRRPQCPVCGEGKYRERREPEPVVLRSRKKRYIAEGGHRSALPQETFERYQHLISPITGVVSSLLPKQETSGGLTYSYAAGHSFPHYGARMLDLRANLRSRSGGKGMSDIEARVGALCEGIERYSGLFHGDEVTVGGSYNSLKPEAIHLNECLLFSEEQYRNRRKWNAEHTQHNFYHVVPEPFDADMSIQWAPIWSLTQQKFRYIPAAYCYYGHPELDKFFCASDTNGSAAGNTLEEAILQGFMELVERDSVALWWYNRVLRPAVDWESFDLPYLRDLQRYYRKIFREFWVLDISTDLGIPAFAAICRRTDRPVEDIIIGFSAHLDAASALLHSVMEVNQFLPSLLQIAPDGSTLYWYDDQEAIQWWKTATVAGQPYLLPDTRVPPRKLSDYPLLGSDDLMTDVYKCVAIAEQHGLETLVLDQTRPDIGLSVVKVIVPGLRHFWRRLGPGRLYDVPVKLGWLAEPRREDQLNPISMFF